VIQLRPARPPSGEIPSSTRTQRWCRLIIGWCLLSGLSGSSVQAIEIVNFLTDSQPREVAGRVLVEAQDGGLLLEGPDRHWWVILPEAIRARDRNDQPFEYLPRAAAGQQLLADLPPGFAIHETAHYLICYNTSPAYAQWCGALYERLYRAFFNFWEKKGLQLNEPDYLVSIVFRDRVSYEAYGADELGTAAGSIVGYYSLATNRITTYDLTGLEELDRSDARGRSPKRVNAILSQPHAERTVATIIHEATHQLAFNCGMQVRFADNPLWVSEGLAIYFESPDLSSTRGWRKIGAMHPTRLQTLRNNLPHRAPDSLLTLISDDRRFRETAQAEVAYAEAWALCYFLIRQHSAQFCEYLQALGHKSALGQDTAEERRVAFEQAFGRSWQELDVEFMRAVATWR